MMMHDDSWVHQGRTQSSGSILSPVQYACRSDLHMPDVQKTLYHRCQVKCSGSVNTVGSRFANAGDHYFCLGTLHDVCQNPVVEH